MVTPIVWRHPTCCLQILNPEYLLSGPVIWNASCVNVTYLLCSDSQSIFHVSILATWYEALWLHQLCECILLVVYRFSIYTLRFNPCHVIRNAVVTPNVEMHPTCFVKILNLYFIFQPSIPSFTSRDMKRCDYTYCVNAPYLSCECALLVVCRSSISFYFETQNTNFPGERWQWCRMDVLWIKFAPVSATSSAPVFLSTPPRCCILHCRDIPRARDVKLICSSWERVKSLRKLHFLEELARATGWEGQESKFVSIDELPRSLAKQQAILVNKPEFAWRMWARASIYIWIRLYYWGFNISNCPVWIPHES